MYVVTQILYFDALSWNPESIIITDYLQPASFELVDTYCYDIDIRKVLSFLNHW